MDKKLAGLLGAAAAVTTLASAQAGPTPTPQLPEATSYRVCLIRFRIQYRQTMRGWLNLKGLKEPNWLRFRSRLVTATTIITAGIIITTTIITITTIIIITRAYKEKEAFTRTSLFPARCCLWVCPIANNGRCSRSVLKFRWQEHGGPPVRAPPQHGFGTTLIEATFGEVSLTMLAKA